MGNRMIVAVERTAKGIEAMLTEVTETAPTKDYLFPDTEIGRIELKNWLAHTFEIFEREFPTPVESQELRR